jgi:hypothetical protein
MIGRSDYTECCGVEPETTVEAGAIVEQES